MPYPFTSIYFDNPIVPGRVLDVFTPEQTTRDEAVFFVHGGGWRGGARDGEHAIMRALNAHGFICASTDYRLTGTTVFDELADVRHGYDAFTSWLGEHGRPVRVFVMGSSAGAHLAALLTVARPGRCGEPLAVGDTAYRNDWVPPIGAAVQSTPVTFEPWEEIFPHVWTSMQGIVGVPYATDPEPYRRVSPIRYVSADTPPMFFLEAENEHMFPLDQTLRMVQRMHAAGCVAEYKVYTRAEHGFFYDVTRRQQREALADVVAFIDRIAAH